MTNNEAGSSIWDVRNFADVSTSTVKIEVDTIYTSSGLNGFKEIEFYHDNCIRGSFLPYSNNQFMVAEDFSRIWAEGF